MRTLTRYLTTSFIVTFLMAFLVITFVMSIGIVFKVTDLVARGVSWQPVVKILAYGMPEALTYSLPLSVLTACLLVYGRMSSDGEITAMRASGINLWWVLRPPCLIAGLLSLFSMYVNNEVVPRGHLARRQEVARLGVQAPLELLDEGRFITDFPGVTLYVQQRRDDALRNVRIVDLRNPKVRREIRAASGRVRESNGDLMLDLRDVRIDPFSDDRPGAAYCEEWTVTVPRRDQSGMYRPRKDDLTLIPLLRAVRDVRTFVPEIEPDAIAIQRSVLAVELNKRFALAAACLSFAVLGVPLGIRAQRRESSVGIGISLLLVVNFYVFVLVAEALEKRPELIPHVIAWLPIAISLIVGTRLIERQN